MELDKIHRQLQELFLNYDLGALIEKPQPVTGGLMHQMYHVTTKNGSYAVKAFNPSVMKRTGVIDNILHSERIAVALSAVIPAITAKSFHSHSLLNSNNSYYMIFDWIDGEAIFPPKITVSHCSLIGTVLGKIHKAEINISGIAKTDSETSIYPWEDYLLLGKKSGAVWVDDLNQLMNYLHSWNIEVNTASLTLSKLQVLSHRDLDPKNVMWNSNTAYIIDWEAAGYVNPHQELLEVINYWADNGNGGLDKNMFDAIYQAYREIAGIHKVDWNAVLASGYAGMLGWLDYSFRRSLGLEASSSEEKVLGTEQVLNTLKELMCYSQKTAYLYDWLKG